ncbi:MAG: pseudouridine synthase, partial [Rhodobacteraceae bacterium]|nr:pseudouridine synthase [Paracoccaceae bacterium]
MSSPSDPPRPSGRTRARAAPEGTRVAAERIAKVLSRAGAASRREAEVMVAEGRVSVNGKVIDTPATLVRPGDAIAIDGVAVAEPGAPRLWRYHKPTGVVVTSRDEKGRTSLPDVLPEGMPRVMPVGRLDINSEGLLLLTNDGGLKRRLELPSTGWLRRYRVRVHGVPGEDQIAPLRQGIELEGERFQPMEVTIDRQQGANAWVTIGLREGRNREVRRAMEAVGLVVNRLIRVSYGPFRLGDLAPGAVEEIRPRHLRDQLGEGVAGDTDETGRRGAADSSVSLRKTAPRRKPVVAAKPEAGAERPARRASGTARPGPRSRIAEDDAATGGRAGGADRPRGAPRGTSAGERGKPPARRTGPTDDTGGGARPGRAAPGRPGERKSDEGGWQGKRRDGPPERGAQGPRAARQGASGPAGRG